MALLKYTQVLTKISEAMLEVSSTYISKTTVVVAYFVYKPQGIFAALAASAWQGCTQGRSVPVPVGRWRMRRPSAGYSVHAL